MGFNQQNCLVAKIFKISALLKALPKAFDFLPNNLIIAKLHAYDFDIHH